MIKTVSNGMEFITISNNKNLKIIFNNLGASIYCIYFCGEIMTPQVEDEKNFLNENVRFGKIVGRVAGRIPNHTLCIDGKTYDLSYNERTNTLHGGHDGIATKFFKSLYKEEKDCFVLIYNYLSKHLESGFPGNANIEIIYKIYKEIDKIDILFNVTVSESCPISLTTHTFFNLGDKNVDQLSLKVNSSKYIRASYETLVQESVEEIPSCLDFRTKRSIITTIDDPLINCGVIGGYDHYLLIENVEDCPIVLENKKYKLEINTDYNSAVFYSDNNIDNYKTNNSSQNCRRGLAIEPQISCMDNLILNPCDKYVHKICYKFLKK